MDSNREKKLITNICQIKGYCPRKYLPQVIQALESNDTFEGFVMPKKYIDIFEEVKAEKSKENKV